MNPTSADTSGTSSPALSPPSSPRASSAVSSSSSDADALPGTQLGRPPAGPGPGVPRVRHRRHTGPLESGHGHGAGKDAARSYFFERQQTLSLAWDCLLGLLTGSPENQRIFRQRGGHHSVLPLVAAPKHRDFVLQLFTVLISEDTSQVSPHSPQWASLHPPSPKNSSLA